MEKYKYLQKNNEFRIYGKGILFNNGFALNETASFIFKMCNGENSLIEIINALSNDYNVPNAELLLDVRSCIEEMLKNELIVKVQK